MFPQRIFHRRGPEQLFARRAAHGDQVGRAGTAAGGNNHRLRLVKGCILPFRSQVGKRPVLVVRSR